MTDILWVLLGVAIGGVVATVRASRVRSTFLRQLDEARKDGARAVQFAKDKLRQRDDDLASYRSRAEEEREVARDTQSRLQTAYTSLSDEKEQLEKTNAELVESVGRLKAEVQTARDTQIRLQGDYRRVSAEKAQVEKARTELAESVNRLQTDVQAAQRTVSQLQADYGHAKVVNAQLENVTARLAKTVETLRMELGTLKDEGFRELEQFRSLGISLKEAVETYERVVGAMESHLGAAERRSEELEVPSKSSMAHAQHEG